MKVTEMPVDVGALGIVPKTRKEIQATELLKLGGILWIGRETIGDFNENPPVKKDVKNSYSVKNNNVKKDFIYLIIYIFVYVDYQYSRKN